MSSSEELGSAWRAGRDGRCAHTRTPEQRTGDCGKIKPTEGALAQAINVVRGVNEAASRIGRDGKGKDGAVGYFVWLAAVQRRCCTLGSAVVSFLYGGLTVQRNFRSFCVLLEEIGLFLTL